MTHCALCKKTTHIKNDTVEAKTDFFIMIFSSEALLSFVRVVKNFLIISQKTDKKEKTHKKIYQNRRFGTQVAI